MLFNRATLNVNPDATSTDDTRTTDKREDGVRPQPAPAVFTPPQPAPAPIQPVLKAPAPILPPLQPVPKAPEPVPAQVQPAPAQTAPQPAPQFTLPAMGFRWSEDVVSREQVNTFFGLAASPFTITPDPNLVFFSETHRLAFSEILCSILDHQGYIAMTGDIGCGKSTLCRLLLNHLGEKVNTALIINPHLSEMQLLSAIVEDFGIQPKKRSKKSHLDALNEFLMNQWTQGHSSVLIIDEAQNMTRAALESVRVLSNFETNDVKLLQTVLVGQPELRDTLTNPSLTQLRQRISTWVHLTPLSRADTAAYIDCRLNAVTGKGRVVFSPDAVDTVFAFSLGTPRMINVVCDRILRLACHRQEGVISGELAAQAVTKVNSPTP